MISETVSLQFANIFHSNEVTYNHQVLVQFRYKPMIFVLHCKNIKFIFAMLTGPKGVGTDMPQIPILTLNVLVTTIDALGHF